MSNEIITELTSLLQEVRDSPLLNKKDIEAYEKILMEQLDASTKCQKEATYSMLALKRVQLDMELQETDKRYNKKPEETSNAITKEMIEESESAVTITDVKVDATNAAAKAAITSIKKLLATKTMETSRELTQEVEAKEEIINISGNFISNKEEWKKKLEELKTYLNQHNKRPSSEDKNKDVKKYGKWINHQISNHKKKEYIMSIESIRQLWENFINDDKYKNYFISNHEKWKLKLEQVKEYINTHQKAPYGKCKDTQEKIYYNWIICQRTSYKGNYNIMSNESIRRLWEDFINEYKNYFK
jgi:hypothetical protein